MSMITATAWVRRGVSAQFPIKYEIDEGEIQRISKLARIQLEDARRDLDAVQEKDAEATDTIDDDNAKKKGSSKKAKKQWVACFQCDNTMM